MKCYHAIAVSGGIGIGRTVRLRSDRPISAGTSNKQNKSNEKISYEYSRYLRAAKEFAARNFALVEKISLSSAADCRDILSVQQILLDDTSFARRLEECFKQGKTAEEAVSEVCIHYASVLEGMENPRIRQRGADYRDMEEQLLDILAGYTADNIDAIPENSILIVDEITPSLMFRLADKKVQAILVKKGGYTSHASIIARALEIPVLIMGDIIWDSLTGNEPLVVDAAFGNVYTHADEDFIQDYRNKAEAYRREREKLRILRDYDTKTADGIRIYLQANITGPDEAAQAMEEGAEGVGLLRTELMFNNRKALPDEEEQYRALKDCQEYLRGKEMLVRTFDLAGDKKWNEYSTEEKEGLALWLEKEELHRPQLRAVLRAAVRRPLALIIPGVSSVEEVHRFKKLLYRMEDELNQEKIQWKEPHIGVMMETVDAWRAARDLAGEVEFFCIGTNDLISDILGEDRLHKAGYSLYDPVALRAVHDIIEEGHRAGIPVSMCGEAAAEPALIPLWIAWGLDALSVNPVSFLSVRQSIGLWKKAEAVKIAEHLWELSEAQEIMRYLCKQKR